MLLVEKVFKKKKTQKKNDSFMFSLTNRPTGDGVLSQLTESETK